MRFHSFRLRLFARALLLVAATASLLACVAPVHPYYAGPVYYWPHYYHYYWWG